MSSPEEEYRSKVVDLPDARRPVVCYLGGGRNVGRKSYKCGGPYQKIGKIGKLDRKGKIGKLGNICRMGRIYRIGE